jgi:hypothetical protein
MRELINKFMGKIIYPEFVFFAALFFLICTPLLFFGHPGYYGDDLHLIEGISSLGVFGAIENWMNEYGAGYRPGVALLYYFYYVFSDSPALMYFLNIICFFSIALVVYRGIIRLFDDQLLAASMAGFVVFFPLSSTSYLQLSSMTMFISVILVVGLTFRLISNTLAFEKWPLWMAPAILWVLALWIYEQPIALILFAFVTLILCLRFQWFLHSGVSIFKLGTCVTLATLIFLGGYLGGPNNPKMKSVKNYQAIQSTQIQTLLEKKGLAKIPIEINKDISQNKRPTDAVLITSRLQKLQTFFIDNFYYVFANASTEPFFIVVYIGCVGLIIFSVISLQARRIPRGVALVILLLGLFWAFLSVLPFFLYGRFTAPAYVFVLPSVGLGAAVFGSYWTFMPQAFAERVTALRTLKMLTITLFIIFSVQQVGYFFGLQEELRYSKALATFLDPHKSDLLEGSTIAVRNFTEKKNRHIFWLEKAMGRRLLINNMGHEFNAINVRRDSIDGVLIISNGQELVNHQRKLLNFN